MAFYAVIACWKSMDLPCTKVLVRLLEKTHGLL